ncbi:MAG: 50S ribosomal protein L14e [Candidatus Heimdallarchaeota archaeon]|nr:50S ribosomal protein L14e [Candidatus Heimdallarchaeota archaeon]
MSAISVGRIVVKVMGRESGKKAIVTKIIDKNFVEISGPFDLSGIKRRRVNMSHIEPTNLSIDIKKVADDDAKIKSLVEKDQQIKEALLEKI